jgi:conjugal transfer pilus assembly protein TraW
MCITSIHKYNNVLQKVKFFLFLCFVSSLQAATVAPKIIAPKIIDLGNHGALFDVAEEDMIRVLQHRLENAKKNGELDALKTQMRDTAKRYVHRPTPHVLPKNQHISRHTVDPTLVILDDIKMPDGHYLAKAFDRINPLHTVRPSKPMLFINGDDVDHVVMSKHVKESVIIVLTNGAPLDLEEDFKTSIFFDQGGYLVQKFAIKSLPALVYPKENTLHILEFPAEKPEIITPILASFLPPESPSADGVFNPTVHQSQQSK